ncbi:MAG TPA: methyl-accepting chemotaxis protein, partial [Egibacteraceae bacterium]|nr:methyl-accepting chemotaxis protein [Egibacteraceae bacterium]
MSWVSNLKIGRRLMLAFGALLALSVIVGGLGITKISAVDQRYGTTLDLTADQLVVLGNSRADIGNEIASALRFQLNGNPKDAEAFETAAASAKKNFVALLGLATSAEGRRRIEELTGTSDRLTALFEEATALRRQGRSAEARALIAEKVAPVRVQLFEQLAGYTDYRVARTEAESAALSATTRSTVWLMVGVLAVALLIGAVLAFVITRSVVRPLRRLEDAVGTAAKGDLTVSVDATARDEVGQVSRSFDAMVSAVRGLVAQVADQARALSRTASDMAQGSTQAGSAVSEIASTVDGVARGSGDQAKSTQEVTATVAEMGSGVQMVAEGGQRAAAASEEADAAARDGVATVRHATDAMARIEHSVAGVAEVVTGLGAKSQEIGQIVG